MTIVYEQDSATVGNFGQFWIDSSYPWPDPVYVDVANETNTQALAEFMENAQINVFPTILFLYTDEDGSQRIVTRLEGEQTYNKIKRVAQDVTAGLYNNITDGDTPEGKGWIDLGELFKGPRLLLWAAVLLYAATKK